MLKFIEALRKRLQEPLPGEAAHNLMASVTRSNIKFKTKPDSQTKESAVLLLFYQDEDKIKLPLILRPVYVGVHSGQIGLPGGRMEEGDKDFFETALREANEEIGINPADVTVIGHLSDLFVFASNYMVHPVVGYMKHRPTFLTDPREVDQLIEVPLSTLLDKSSRGITNIVVSGNMEVSAPYFDVDGHTVWGATAMMLSELLSVIDDLEFPFEK
ncbi:NUDIX hydrolase [Pontibacter akesuensis]|uniref:NUDIX domain-containing protein n=1 Tax=Pontibacter akesuensis TaxID=388950 RepID=A0A1I7KLP5_9BACT|nr:CoA pyrophosphatase [Pontibacter akesuensis]GHA77841.1 coenzyme A pyrophosphatase [Pontibacter akesuensis]SFU98348.1 NUDIX domain-containing protein [Pontibacter akesuensis]